MQSRERSLEGFKKSSGPGQGLLSCIAKEILFNMVKIKQMKEGRANCVDIREGNDLPEGSASCAKALRQQRGWYVAGTAKCG